MNTKRFYRILLLFLACPLLVFPQAKWNSAYQKYIDSYKDLAIEQMLRHNIPASITLSQGILESAAGTSKLATYGNNHFGIKCHDWTGPSMRKDDDAPNECFRVYNSPRESFEDHSRFLLRPRYSSLFNLRRTDYKGWARGLKECGYATSPVYAQSLISIIETYNLHEFDKAKSYNRKAAGDPNAPHHQIYSYNKNYYIVAHSGETFKSLADEMGISYKKLAKYNERDRSDVLAEGDIIYLKKKQSHAPKEYKNRKHIVRAGESIYSISQLYGMRISAIYKLNNLPMDYQIHAGDSLKVR